ncbi:cadherin repeat domain-containing protein [Aquimarina algiphila]|uniref:cadherin repeat domain-containing protein n=1 Tax=Aquimarina algiphila TaxID=2047982 RepID=UPI00232FDBF1|nr:cadherin repeat domain-containing protein [Aquimarina algiphila]
MKKELLKIFVAVIIILVSCSKDDGNAPGNTAPVMTAQSFTVTEALDSGSIVGVVTATDADDDELVFTITTNSGTLFTIDDLGTIKLAQNEQLDFEMASTHTIVVEVSDGKSNVSVEITINVTDVNETADIYIAGIYTQSELNQDWAEAAYWKNGEIVLPTTSPSEDYPSATYSIFVEGNDIYVAGYEVEGPEDDLKEIAKYWKNGNDVSLSLGDGFSRARAIVVDGSDVYVCGQEDHPDYGNVPKYWKNGNATILDTDAIIAWDITKAGEDIHIAGYGEVPGMDGRYALHWKNGNGTAVSTENATAQARAIAVSGNDVYLGGFETLQGELEAKIWKNGQSISLSDANNCGIEDIAVSGNDVYAVGYEFEEDGNIYYAKYWKNGESFRLSGGTNAIALGVAVFNNDFYVVGRKGTTTWKGVLWKNGVQVPEYTVDNAEFRSIFIQ